MNDQKDLDRESSIAIVIVNYKTPQLTIDCLSSLADEISLLPQAQVIVVDNASGDNSFEIIKNAVSNNDGWNNWISMIESDINGGFAFGNNLAIRPVLESANPPSYILLLNPDTVIRPQAIQTLIKFMEQNPEVGIAGSRLEDPDGTPQRSAFRFLTLLSELESGVRLGFVSNLLKQWIVAPEVSDIPCQTDWVAGASMIIRREVFTQIGLLDEAYFMYYEEADFCLKANQAGWQCWYVPESKVVHLVGQSSDVNNSKIAPKRRPQYWFDSRKRYFLTNYGWFYTALADLFFLLGFILWRIRRPLQNKPDLDPPNFVADFWKNTVFYPGNLFSNHKNNAESLEVNLSEDQKTESASDFGLWEQIKEDWIAHECDWTKPGFRAVVVYRFGVWRMKIKSKLLRAPFSIIYRAMYRKIRNHYGIELPYTVQLGRRVIIEHQSGIVIHGNTIIGDDSIIRQGVTLGNRYLDKPFDAPKLGTRVNVGAGAKILGGVTIGDDASIGANAVVLADIPSGKTAVGIPAKIIN